MLKTIFIFITTAVSILCVLRLFIIKGKTVRHAIIEIAITVLFWIITVNLETMSNFISEKLFSDNDSNHQHIAFITESENQIEPSCLDDGFYDSVEYCECGIELHREKIIIPALGHSYKSVKTKPLCDTQGFTTHTCSVCSDSYVDNYTDELGHNFIDGLCTRCGIADTNYVKIYTSEEILRYLSSSIVASSGTYADYFGSDKISVFAEEKSNCFSINTAVSYNLWGGNVQYVNFNISNLTGIEELAFDIGGETGSSGSMTVEIFINKTMEESADYIYEIEASAIPTHVSINIKDAISLGFRVTNHSNNQNRLVFFNFSDGSA